jgi:hypothetical protein
MQSPDFLCRSRTRRLQRDIDRHLYPSAQSSAIATSTLASRPNSDYIQSDAEVFP